MIGSERRTQARALREEIDQTRTDLGDTVQELAARVDVPARMRARYRRGAARVRRAPVAWLAATGGAVVAAVAIVLVVRGRRR